jgi:hypothetical protein
LALAAYFCHSSLSQVEHNFSLIKVNWFAAFWIALEFLALCYSFSSGVGANLHNPPANGKQGPIPEEISQTC